MSVKDYIEMKEEVNGEEKELNECEEDTLSEKDKEKKELEKKILKVSPKDFWKPGLSFIFYLFPYCKPFINSKQNKKRNHFLSIFFVC
jgi:hypothetical protein